MYLDPDVLELHRGFRPSSAGGGVSATTSGALVARTLGLSACGSEGGGLGGVIGLLGEGGRRGFAEVPAGVVKDIVLVEGAAAGRFVFFFDAVVGAAGSWTAGSGAVLSGSVRGAVGGAVD